MQHVLTIFVCPAENLKRGRKDISINKENAQRITIISQKVRNCSMQPALIKVHVQICYIKII